MKLAYTPGGSFYISEESDETCPLMGISFDNPFSAKSDQKKPADA